MDLLQKLQLIQIELKAPKGQFNAFGKYKYRSAEDILESLKPMEEKYNVLFKTSDELRDVCGHVYVECTAKIIDIENPDIQIESKGQAIIDFEAKGMQMPQRTGAASSYAKKYAYGNLLLIDDTKDSDAVNTHGDNSKPELVGESLEKALALFKEGKVKLEDIRKKYSVSSNNIKKFA